MGFPIQQRKQSSGGNMGKVFAFCAKIQVFPDPFYWACSSSKYQNNFFNEPEIFNSGYKFQMNSWSEEEARTMKCEIKSTMVTCYCVQNEAFWDFSEIMVRLTKFLI